MTDKKLINVKITEINERILLDCSIDNAIMQLENIKTYYTSKGFQELELYGYDGAYQIYLYGKRLETDKEFKDRLKKEQHEAELRKEAEDKKQTEELKLYKKLQKKYGKLP